MITIVAFDWNGTLIADTQTVVDCTNQQLKIFGNKKIDIKIYRDTFEIPVNKFFENIGITKANIQKNYYKSGDIFHNCYEEKVEKLRTRSGTKKILRWLNSQNIKSVIFSNHATERIEKQLKRLGIDDYFDTVLANSHTHDSYTIKGKEKRLVAYLRKKKFKTEQLLIVGDTEEEIIIGKDMGVITVAITDGHSTTQRLRAAKPNYLISNFGQLANIVRKLNS